MFSAEIQTGMMPDEEEGSADVVLFLPIFRGRMCRLVKIFYSGLNPILSLARIGTTSYLDGCFQPVGLNLY